MSNDCLTLLSVHVWGRATPTDVIKRTLLGEHNKGWSRGVIINIAIASLNQLAAVLQLIRTFEKHLKTFKTLRPLGTLEDSLFL